MIYCTVVTTERDFRGRRFWYYQCLCGRKVNVASTPAGVRRSAEDHLHLHLPEPEDVFLDRVFGARV